MKIHLDQKIIYNDAMFCLDKLTNKSFRKEMSKAINRIMCSKKNAIQARVAFSSALLSLNNVLGTILLEIVRFV